MTVQGLGQGYGYYPGVVPEQRQIAFSAQPQQMEPQARKRSFVGGLIRAGIVITLLAKALKTGGSYKSILKLAKKQGVTTGLGKAKLFGKAYLKNLNPKNWKITKKAVKFFAKNKEAAAKTTQEATVKTTKAAKQTVKVAKVETTPEGYKLITDLNGTKILDKGGSYEVIRDDVVKTYYTKLRKPGSMNPIKEILALPQNTKSSMAAKEQVIKDFYNKPRVKTPIPSSKKNRVIGAKSEFIEQAKAKTIKP